MSRNNKPKTAPATPFPTEGLHRVGGWLWLPLRSEWRDVSTRPEEEVRQGFIRHLAENLGYDLAQMDQERRTQHGHRSPRADIVVWKTREDKLKGKNGAAPGLVIECKAEHIDIQTADYYQGESYARAAGADFFIAHNARYTAVFKVVQGMPGEFVQVNDIPKAADWSDAKRIEAIKNSLRAFNRDEFQKLLFNCHCILRDVHAMDPGRAFDTISKVLFIKMYVERSGLHGTFTTGFLDGRAKYSLKKDVPVHEQLFQETKDYYRSDDLFAENDRLEISEQTFRRIVEELEPFNLSKTGDDIKGLAFERFLGTTFRGNLGQFFTPRPVVDFMVDLIDPKESELICDPAAGSGGFLIRAFEHVRGKIQADILEQKKAARAEIEALGLLEEEEERRIEAAFAKLNKELLPSGENNQVIDTRVGRLAWQCVYGSDKEPRAARTAKMNMIMHGDGHGGIHYHDGLVDINGIFPGRFDVVLTNPPFGANVGKDQKVGHTDESKIPNDPDYLYRCQARYGDAWKSRHATLLKGKENNTPILDLFEIGQGKPNRATELLFVERCLELLRPGGRMGIVLPDGNLNNPSLSWLRRWAEGKAHLLAVVSLPEETFRSSAATVKASLVFLRRFDAADEAAWETAWASAHAQRDAEFNARRDALHAEYAPRIVSADDVGVAALLAEFAALGLTRVLLPWRTGDAPAYPRGIGPTQLSKPYWTGQAKDAKDAGTGQALGCPVRRTQDPAQGGGRSPQHRPVDGGSGCLRLPGVRRRAQGGGHQLHGGNRGGRTQ